MDTEQLVWSVKNGDTETVKSHLSSGFDVNKNIMSGRNALHFAADYGQCEIIELLISKGANVNQPDQHGITPLLAAIFESHTAAVKLLLDKGANKSGKAPDGSSYKDSAEKNEIKELLN